VPERIRLLDHPIDSPTAFSPESLVEAVRSDRHLDAVPIPEVCILEFDGDLTDWLVSTGLAKPYREWACFHSTMYSFDMEGVTYGIVPRTIGGPYAVLVAEQMAVSGARLVLGLTSAGRVAHSMPLPGLVVATSAIRDEGTSYHYLEASAAVEAPPGVAKVLESELRGQKLPVVRGTLWTTDAPYRETGQQLAEYAKEGVLAVEMQAASLFAFSKSRGLPVGVVAHVTNEVERTEKEFDKGSREAEFEVLKRICRAGRSYLSQ
jgi:uridine phosphorylase